MFGVQVCVFVFEAERQDVLRVKPFLFWDAHLPGVWNAHSYGSARRCEEWISDVGFGEARLWGGGAERLRHRSEADASASAITALSGGPLWNFTLWKADKSSFSPFLLANPSRHTSKHVPALLLFFHMHSHFPHTTRCFVYLFLRMSTASHLSIPFCLFMHPFSPTVLPIFQSHWTLWFGSLHFLVSIFGPFRLK